MRGLRIILLLLLCLAMAVAGATSETVNGWLYQQWPRLATLLMPVNMSCEDQGIRMEVISAVAEGNEVLINYSMQDLEGSRKNVEFYIKQSAEYLAGSPKGENQ